MGNLNSKTYYFRFAVLFSYLQYFPLLKPKFFLLKLIFLKNSNFFKTQAFFKLRFFKRTQMFSKLRVFFFFRTQVFFKKKLSFFFKIQLNNAHVIQPRPQGFSLKKWVGREKVLASAGHVYSLNIPEKLIYMQPAGFALTEVEGSNNAKIITSRVYCAIQKLKRSI